MVALEYEPETRLEAFEPQSIRLDTLADHVDQVLSEASDTGVLDQLSLLNGSSGGAVRVLPIRKRQKRRNALPLVRFRNRESVRNDLREELLGAFARGFHKEPFLRAVFQNLPRFHEDHAVGNLAGKAHFVRDDHHRHAFFCKAHHHVEHFVDHFGVKCRRRFVKEHAVGIHREGTGDGDALLLTARELPRELRSML